MECAELEALLCDYVDGTLAAEQAAAVREHLARCAACRELVEDASRAVVFLRRLEPVEPPGELLTRLLFQISTQPPVPRRRGLRGLFGGWLEPVFQPRFAMGMAMTILSISLVARSLGLPQRTLRPADLRPSAVIAAVDERLHRTWDALVKYYENLRVVYEIRNRLSEWASEQEAGAEEPAPAEAAPPGPPSPGAGQKE
jgi:anti-sigma factor RsiW